MASNCGVSWNNQKAMIKFKSYFNLWEIFLRASEKNYEDLKVLSECYLIYSCVNLESLLQGQGQTAYQQINYLL